MNTRCFVNYFRTSGALIFAISLAGCAGSSGTRNSPELKVPGPATAPRISQVAIAANIVGRQGNDQDALLGRSLAVGDFNGDGFADAAAGIPGENGGRGAVALLYGNAGGLDLTNPDLNTRARLSAAALTGFGNDQAGDQFGYAVAAGDFDGDGLTDLAIGAPFRSAGGRAGSGEVFIAYGDRSMGPAAMIIRTNRFTQTGAGSNEADDHFGMSLAAGDFNGDGFHDLAIGAPDEDDEGTARTESGAVFIRYGSRSGLASLGYHVITAAHRNPGALRNPVTSDMNGTETGERFGHALAAAMLHRNAFRYSDDLVVGAPGKDVRIDSGSSGLLRYANAGKVYVYAGVADEYRFVHQADLIASLAPTGIVGFGSALAAGDYDHDGNLDLAIGAPDAGAVYGSSGGRVFTAMYFAADNALGRRAFPDIRETNYYRRADRMLDQEPIARVRDGDQFGFALAAADFNRDGFADLAVGAPRKDWGATNNGLVFVFMGSAGGLQQTYGCRYFFMDQSPRGANENGDRFGFALAPGVFRRLNGDLVSLRGDRFPDLVVSAPYENDDQSGAVFVAATSTVTGGPYEGNWTGVVTGDGGTSANVTVSLCDRSAVVAGSAALDGDVTFVRCTDGIIGALTGGGEVTLGRSADINATKTSSGSRHAEGSLLNLNLPATVRATTTVIMDLTADQNTLNGTIRVRDVQVNDSVLGWVSPGSCADIDLPVRLTRAP